METSMIVALGANRTVTARELGRGVAALLDEVELERRAILVTRAGRPVALLTPVERGTRAGPPQEEDVQDVEFQLEPHYRKVLAAIARHAPDRWSPGQEDLGQPVQRTLAALGGLELKGLITLNWGGTYTLQPKGARVAACLLPKEAE